MSNKNFPNLQFHALKIRLSKNFSLINFAENLKFDPTTNFCGIKIILPRIFSVIQGLCLSLSSVGGVASRGSGVWRSGDHEGELLGEI